ncbi:MAG: hypothetical protein ACREQ5_29660, partial [Candidatus Dormibacteria bacterium]
PFAVADPRVSSAMRALDSQVSRPNSNAFYSREYSRSGVIGLAHLGPKAILPQNKTTGIFAGFVQSGRVKAMKDTRLRIMARAAKGESSGQIHRKESRSRWD